MKKIIIALVLMLGLIGTASAEIIEKQRHRDWESFILTFDGGVCARMSTVAGTTMLIVDVFPKSEQYPYGMYQVKMIEPLSADQKAGWEMMLPLSSTGKMRVDSRTVYDVTFDFSMLDNFLFVNLAGQFGQTLVNEAKRGIRLHMRLDPLKSGQNPAMTTFSLMGFTAAYNRCMNFLPLLERMTSPAPVPTPAPHNDPFADFGKDPAPKKAEPPVPPAPPVDDAPRPEYRNAVTFM